MPVMDTILRTEDPLIDSARALVQSNRPSPKIGPKKKSVTYVLGENKTKDDAASANNHIEAAVGQTTIREDRKRKTWMEAAPWPSM